MDNYFDIATILGTGGILWGFIQTMRKEHRIDRKEESIRNQRNFDKLVEISERQNDDSKKSTEALTKMSTILDMHFGKPVKK